MVPKSEKFLPGTAIVAAVAVPPDTDGVTRNGPPNMVGTVCPVGFCGKM